MSWGRRGGLAAVSTVVSCTQSENKISISNCVAVHVKSRGMACLVWDYLTPTLTQTNFTIPLAQLRKKWPRFYCRGHDDSKRPVASSFRCKNNSSPKMKGAGFSETLVTDYHTRCHIQRDTNFHKLYPPPKNQIITSNQILMTEVGVSLRIV